MPVSQNAIFAGAAPVDEEFSHPPGASIARELCAGLIRQGWDIADMENWRDSGWLLRCARENTRQEITLAQSADEGQWFLQIAPSSVPGLIGRLFGRKASAEPADVLRLAKAAHELLSTGAFTYFRWEWDDYPDKSHSSPEPTARE